MKKYIIIILALFYCSQIFAQAIPANVSISSIDNQYLKSKYIGFRLKNNSGKETFAQVSLERLIKDEWVEILDDVFKSRAQINSKVVSVAILAGGETRLCKWKPVFDLPKNVNLRLKVTCFHKQRDGETYTYSQEFIF